MIKFKKPLADDLSRDDEIFKKISFEDTKPSPDDSRDFVACIGAEDEKFPEEYRAPETEILDQEDVSSCVAHACVTALAQGEEVKLTAHNDYSRGYIYGNRRATDHQGEGMYIRQALKQLNHCGDVYYDDFPYNKNYNVVSALISARKDELATKALPHAIIDYSRCYTDTQIKKAIMQHGGCIICVPVYTDFARDLHVTKTNNLRGYHAMIIIGWTEDGKWIVQNSWGKRWGYDGCLLMDDDYPVDEYWSISVQTDKIEPKPLKKTWWQKLIDWLKNLFSKKK